MAPSAPYSGSLLQYYSHVQFQSQVPYSGGRVFQPQSHLAMNVRSSTSPSTQQQEFWLLDSGATNHMTSDLSNLQMVTPYSSTEKVIGANCEGLDIAHIGSSNLHTLSLILSN